MLILRELWKPGQVTLGGWCAIGSAFSAELLGRCGYDWIGIDLQHGLISQEQMIAMLQGLSGTGTPALVRVADSNPAGIMRALDAGASGVIVPLVESAHEAARIVQACRYPPDGTRSWGPVRASLGVNEYSPRSANRDVLCIVMIESPAAVAGLDDILTVPGIDAAFIGSNDLALSSGLARTFGPEPSAQLDLVMSIQLACRRHGIVAGIAAGDTEAVLRWHAAGFDMLALPSDIGLLVQGARASVGALRAAAGVKSARRGSDESIEV